jgi:hypothetical protein
MTPPPLLRRGAATVWIVVLLVGVALFVLIPMAFGANGLKFFADTAYARGVITFAISIATIAIAFVLVYQAFFDTTTDDRFRRGREVFTGFMGVLGTIVGFYFGSAGGAGALLSIAAIRLDGRTVTTFVSGGVAPYRFTVSAGKQKSLQKVSFDGWIVDTLAEAPAAPGKVTVEVLDSRSQKESQSLELQKEPGDTSAAPRLPSSPASPDTTRRR